MSRTASFWRFFSQRFPAVKYLAYVAIWSTAILSAMAWAKPRTAPVFPGWKQCVCGALALFVILFFMRVVDEIKDVDYDQKFHQDRPLVSGETDVGTLRSYLIGSAVIALALSLPLGIAEMVTACSIMMYSLILLWLERISPSFRDSMYGNIVVTIQLKAGLIFYVVEVSATEKQSLPVLPTALVGLSFLLAYLYWEMARKTVREDFLLPGEKAYSVPIGAGGSLAVASALMTTACVLRAVVAIHWGRVSGAGIFILFTPLFLVAWVAGEVLRRRSVRYAPGLPAMCAYLVFLFSATAATVSTSHAGPWSA